MTNNHSMLYYYTKRALEILEKKGPWELYRQFWDFLLHKRLLPPELWLKYQTYKNHIINTVRYDMPPDPYLTIRIRPSEIKYGVGTYKVDGRYPVRRLKYRGLGRIKGGDWDTYRVEIKNKDWIQAANQRYLQNKDWKDTEYYQKKIENISSDEVKSLGYNDREALLLQSLRNYDNLYRDIKKNGYKPGHKGSRLQPGSKQPIEDQLEVLVAIDRDGEICYSMGGMHRFGIARVLDLEIPAHVICRHKKWQKERDEIYNNGLSEKSEELRHHPDLQDILD